MIRFITFVNVIRRYEYIVWLLIEMHLSEGKRSVPENFKVLFYFPNVDAEASVFTVVTH